MKIKERFKRKTISDMKAKKEESKMETSLDIIVHEIDNYVEKEVDNLNSELKSKYGNTEGMHIDIVQEQQGNNLVVNLLVVQVAKTLTFDLGSDE